MEKIDSDKIEAIEDRMVEMVFESSPKIFIDWFELIIGETKIEDNIVTYKTFDNRSGGFDFRCDYPTKATMIAFAIAGIWWTKMFPNLLPKVNKVWKKRK